MRVCALCTWSCVTVDLARKPFEALWDSSAAQAGGLLGVSKQQGRRCACHQRSLKCARPQPGTRQQDRDEEADERGEAMVRLGEVDGPGWVLSPRVQHDLERGNKKLATENDVHERRVNGQDEATARASTALAGPALVPLHRQHDHQKAA